jgi:hypothetical protein
MLQSHLAAVEQQLLATSQIPANAGHPLHKGTPREAFVKQFLSTHLGQDLQVETGEIIDGASQPGDARPQIDIVIARSELPRIDFGGGVRAFLAESVVATVEVKSTLDKAGVLAAIEASIKVKALKRDALAVMHAGYQAPSVLCFVVAYACDSPMATVYGWIEDIYQNLHVGDPELGAWPERASISSSSLDGVFVLGKGYILFDNSPLAAAFLKPEHRGNNKIRWLVVEQGSGGLFVFFIQLVMALSGVTLRVFQLGQYLDGFATGPIQAGAGVDAPG